MTKPLKDPQDILKDISHPVPDEWRETVERLANLNARAFWHIFQAALVRLSPDEKKSLRRIIAEFVDKLPDEMAEFKEQERAIEQELQRIDENLKDIEEQR